MKNKCKRRAKKFEKGIDLALFWYREELNITQERRVKH